MKRIIAWFAENSVAANLLMILIIMGGLATVPTIQEKVFPDIDTRMITIAVPYLGAAPEEVEEGVCIRIEEEVFGIEGIERLKSTASEGACTVIAELLMGYPVDRALAEIKNAVDSIDTFPEEAEKPIVSYVDLRRNALQIALAGEAPEPVLKLHGERIRDAISALPEVTQVQLSNARRYEVSIEVPEESLRRHGLTFQQVVDAVRNSSLDLPGGSIKARGGEILLRSKGQARTGEEFERIVVLTREDGTRLLLGEIAHVVDGFEEDPRYARFDGKPAVLIQVYRVGEEKVLELVDAVKGSLGNIAARLPDGLDLTVWRDGSQHLRDRLGILVRNGRSGFILVFAVLALFLRLRLAFWVALSVPVSFLGALWLFPTFGISIDVLSLFAFILVLGILVDDAIVVGESVHSHQERAENPLQSAIQGAQEVAVPVIFGVLTTVVAFVPMIVSPGDMGQFLGTIGIVVISCLFFSLVESQLVLPAHLAHHASPGRDDLGGTGLRGRWKRIQNTVATSLTRLAEEHYRPALERVLGWRYSALAAAAGLLLVTVTMIASGYMRFSFFPTIEGDYVVVNLTMPEGTPVEVTAEAVRSLEESALRVKAELDEEYADAGGSLVRHMLVSVGEHPSLLDNGPPSRGESVASGSHLGEVSVELVSADTRPVSARAFVQRWRELTPPIPDAEEVVFTSDFFSLGDPIDIELSSPNVDELRRASEELKARVAQYPGVFDVTDSFREGKQEMVLAILPSAETLGLTLEDLARQVRQAFYGEEAQRIQRGRDDVRVMVRYPAEQRRSLADLDNLRIRTPEGGEVPFYAVARASMGRGYSKIHRTDRQRVIDVTADLDTTQGSANQILADLQAEFLPMLLAEHPGLSYSLEGEQREQYTVLMALARNYAFALVLIYALLAVPLRSYLQPLIIMAVIPFGLVGAIAGHLLLKLALSMMSFFGVVAVSGVVVNSSLVLVHYVNERRAAGVPLELAVREAGVARFRPIVLTSLTTFAGLTPLMLERSISAQFLIPMAASLAFGVIFATAISLVLVPCGYVVLDDVHRLLRPHDAPPQLEPVEPPTPLQPPARVGLTRSASTATPRRKSSGPA